MQDTSLTNLSLLTPELSLLGFSVLALLAGVYIYQRITLPYFAFICLLVLLVICQLLDQGVASAQFTLSDMLVIDAFSQFSKLLLLLAVLLICLISRPWLTVGQGQPFEFLVLIMMSSLGMMLLISANDLLALYVGIELMSLSLYVLASFNRDDTRSSEAGLKYFILGALASGIMLYGISFIYGFTGTTAYPELRYYFANISGDGFSSINQATLLGMVLIVVGFCFKISAAPFHMWTPDVYEGAPTPVTAFFAIAPKIAAVLAFTRLLYQPFDELHIYWQQLIIAAAIASLLVGALGALMQSNVKRLLAYSSIGHVGFMLIALATGLNVGVQAVIIYLGLYIFMSVGAFGVVLTLKKSGQPLLALSDLKGLSASHPLSAAALAVFMFSMAGIPPLAGFFGKMYVVLAAVNSGLIWLAVLGVLISVIACFYYIRIIKLMYFDEAQEGAVIEVETSLAIRAAIVMSVIVTLLFVIYPTPLVDYAQIASQTLLP